VSFIEANDSIVLLRVDHEDSCGIFRFGHAVYEIKFEAEDVATGGVPRNGAALTDVSKDVMLFAGGDLFDSQIEWSGLSLC